MGTTTVDRFEASRKLLDSPCEVITVIIRPYLLVLRNGLRRCLGPRLQHDFLQQVPHHYQLTTYSLFIKPGTPTSSTLVAMVRISLLTYLALGLGSTTVLADCGQAPTSSPSVQIPTGVLTPVTDFGVNPTGLDLHIYVPKNLAPKPAVILAVRPAPWPPTS